MGLSVSTDGNSILNENCDFLRCQHLAGTPDPLQVDLERRERGRDQLHLKLGTAAHDIPNEIVAVRIAVFANQERMQIGQLLSADPSTRNRGKQILRPEPLLASNPVRCHEYGRRRTVLPQQRERVIEVVGKPIVECEQQAPCGQRALPPQGLLDVVEPDNCVVMFEEREASVERRVVKSPWWKCRFPACIPLLQNAVQRDDRQGAPVAEPVIQR